MNVLYLTYDGVNEKLAQSQILPYLKGLSKLNNNIYLFTFIKGRIAKREIEKTKKDFYLKEIYTFRYHKACKLFSSIYDIICGVLMGLVVTKRHKIDIYHARSYISCAIAFCLKKICKKPYIFDIRGFLAEERVDSGDWKKTSIAYKSLKFAEKYFFKDADFIISLSQKGKDEIVKNFGVNKDIISVIPTCVDYGLFNLKAGSAVKKYDLAYFGSLGTWYLLDEMVDFFKAWHDRHPESKFLFLTDAKKEIIQTALKQKSIDFEDVDIKFVPYNEVGSYLAIAKACIYFIRPCYSKLASCPTKLAEALACGLPIITNKGIGDVEEIIMDNGVGVMVDGFSALDYGKAITLAEKFLQDQNMPSKCRKAAEKTFSLETAVLRYNDIYKTIGKI